MNRVRKETNSNKKIWILIFIVVSVFCLIFFAARGRYQIPLSERIVMTILAPFQGLISTVNNEIRYVTSSVWEIATVYDQNKMLKSEVEQLRALNLQSNELASENARLRTMLAYKQASTQFDLVIAAVIARDSVTWTNTIMINRGTNDGLKKDMAVITSQGLVGNVVEAFSSSAKVELILDPRSAVGTIVQRPESRVAGIVQGNKDDKMMARMVNIPRDADVVEGDQIVTSGFGGVYPKGLAVGIVDRIDNDEGGLLKYAVLKPAVDFQKLEEVAVIINSREALPAPLAPTVPEQTAIESDSAVGDTK